MKNHSILSPNSSRPSRYVVKVAPSRPAKKDPTGAQRIVFSVAALMLPFLVLALLEGGLRLFGYGSHPLLIEPVEGFNGYIQPREDVSARYFHSVRNLPSIPFDWFTEPPSDSTFRIVLQGGSTAAGWPYYFSADLADVVETHLQRLHPDFRFEVMNTSMAAVNSYTLLDLSDEIITLNPDAVLIYAGHNEYYGALGVGSSQGFASGPTLINLYLKLRSLRTVQLLQSGISSIMGWFSLDPTDSSSGNTLMQDMVGEQHIPFGSELYEKGLEQFRFNMGLLLGRYAEAGIPVYIGTLASNLRDQPPFLSGTGGKDASSPDEAIRRAGSLLSRGATDSALVIIEAAIEQTPLHAGAHFVRARTLERLGRMDEALEAYIAAKDRDELRFRAPEVLNDIIRELAARHGAHVVEAQQAMQNASPDGLIGKDMMLEHLHPTVPGYRTLGGAYFMALAGNRFGTDRGLSWTWDQALSERERPTPVPAVDSLSGAYRVQQLTASWPFQPIGSRFTQVDTLLPGTLTGDISLRLFRDDIQRIEALDVVRTAATQQGDLKTARIYLEAVIQSYPMVPGPHIALAKLAMQTGAFDEAERLARAELAIGNHPEAFQVLGTLLLNRHQIDAAIPNLERAVAMNGADLRARYNLAGAYALRQHYGEARKQAEEILRRNPGAEDARRLLASLPE